MYILILHCGIYVFGEHCLCDIANIMNDEFFKKSLEGYRLRCALLVNGLGLADECVCLCEKNISHDRDRYANQSYKTTKCIDTTRPTVHKHTQASEK